MCLGQRFYTILYIQFLTLQEKNVYTEDEFDYWCRDGDLG